MSGQHFHTDWQRLRPHLNLLAVKCVMAVAFAFTPLGSHAKVTLETYKYTDEVTLKIEDEILPPDLEDFKKALAQIDEYHSVLHMNAVHLNSLGGHAMTAGAIGRILRRRNLNTYLGPKDSCASACVDVLIAGVQRFTFGMVEVHRASYHGEAADTETIREAMNGWNKDLADYITEMGASLLLLDATQTTPNWRTRILTPTEIRQWLLLGNDHVTEETMFTELAKEKFISRKEFVDIYSEHYEECLAKARDFEMTVFDCAKQFRSTPIPLWRIVVGRIAAWMNANIGTRPFTGNTSYQERVKAIKKLVDSGQLYQRAMALSTQGNTLVRIDNGRFKLLPAEVAQEMEQTNTWWVRKNKLFIVLKNPTLNVIHRVTFSLTDRECGKKGPKRLIQFELLEPLDRNREVLYSGELPFNYDREIGYGERCGVVEAAFLEINRDKQK
jgi:hypothetical protein